MDVLYMKKHIVLATLVAVTSLQADFDFGSCSGSGSFEQMVTKHTSRDDVMMVGTIPAGIEGLRVSLKSDDDVDVRLYGENDDKVVAWPDGILHRGIEKSTRYKGSEVTYSGYDGVDGDKGDEFIEIGGTVPVDMTMKVFGYRAGHATVKYSWSGKAGCTTQESGTGKFAQELKKGVSRLVGNIPANVRNIDINLTSSNDLDIQLFDEKGTAIISWKPQGLMSGMGVQSMDYHGMRITWSGYAGTMGNHGNEYIRINGTTSEMLIMKVYGYENGNAEVNYAWGTESSIVDGDWSEWSEWSAGSCVYGEKVSTRTRSCDNPAPANGGAECQGESIDRKIESCQATSMTYKTSSTPVQLSELPTDIKESSGLIYIDGRLFTHNDAPDTQNIYEINEAGSILRTIHLPGALQIDWEDITQDETYVYIADIGNNTQYRKPSYKPETIYRVLKSDLLTKTSVTFDKIIYSYSDENPAGAGVPDGEKWYYTTEYDGETLFAYKDSLYVFSKNWKDKITHVYKIPKTPGTYVAPVQATKTLPFLVTAAEANPETNAVALVGYDSVYVQKQYVYVIDNIPGDRFFDGDIHEIDVTSEPRNFHQIEAVAFKDNKTLYISSDKFENIYLGTYPASLFKMTIAE